MAKKKSVKPLPPQDAVEPMAPASVNTRSDYEMGSPVAGVVQVQKIFMVESHATRTVATYTETSNVGTKFTMADVEVGHTENLDYFHVKLCFTVKAWDKDASKVDEASVEISGTFVLLYELSSKEGISVENLVAFARTSAVFSVWPYWREFVHTTSFRLSVPPMVLPTYRI